ncbi:MAG: helix-turn-helix domain-containing protein, partial [Rhodospirillales bacterium]
VRPRAWGDVPVTAGGLMFAVPDALVEDVAEAIAVRAFELLKDRLNGDTPWMTTEEAAAYTRIRPGTFAKLAARGAIPSHSDGGKRNLYHRAELDEYLGYAEGQAPRPPRRALRRADAA